jgi:uncharacterized protein
MAEMIPGTDTVRSLQSSGKPAGPPTRGDAAHEDLLMTRETPTAAAAALAPVATNERIGALDLLRLFGVLWSNLNSSYSNYNAVTSLDHKLAWAQRWLIQDRFYNLLILLFGVGFGIQLIRAEVRGTDVRATYYRRAAALLAIGVVHGTLIYNGDILTIYALVAFALVMFRNASTKEILIAALLFWFIGPAVVAVAKWWAGLRFIIPAAPSGVDFAHATWLEIQRVRVAKYLGWLQMFGLSSYVSILASYLIGLWAVKSGYMRRLFDDPATTRRLLIVSLIAIGVGLAARTYAGRIWPLPPPMAGEPRFPYPGFHLYGVLRPTVFRLFNWLELGTAVAYACALVLIWQRPFGARILRPLSNVGRMALTTYLTQSIVCTLLFYSYGLGWSGGGGVGPTGILKITLVLFACQMLVSTWWLKRFRYGPAEWLWRWLSYGRMETVRVKGDIAQAMGAG